MATPNYSVCACTVIGNRYILWSYSSTQLGKWYGIIFLCNISPFINAPLKVEEVFALFPTSSQNQKPLESWESWDLTWLDSLTWIINKTLHPCPHHVGSRQCPPVSGLASAPVLSAVSPSLYLRLMLSVSAPLSSWQLSSWSGSSDCRCRPSRRLSRSSGTRWPALVTEVHSEICVG